MFKISKKTFYQCRDPKDRFLEKYAFLKKFVKKVIKKNPAYGVKRIKKALFDNYRIVVGKNTLNKLLKLWGLNLKRTIKKSRISFIQKILIKLSHKANLLIQKKIKRPFQAISSDITEILYGGGKAYLCVHKDVFGQMVYGWELDLKMERELALNSFRKTIKQIKRIKKRVKIIFHQDQGSQYTSYDYVREVLKEDKISFSKKGTPTENAGQESFFGRFKQENRYDFYECKTFEELKKLVNKRLRYYNNERIHTSIGTSPKKFTKSYLKKAKIGLLF